MHHPKRAFHISSPTSTNFLDSTRPLSTQTRSDSMKLSKVLFLFGFFSMALLARDKMVMRSASALDTFSDDEAWDEWDEHMVVARSDNLTAEDEPITQTTSSAEVTTSPKPVNESSAPPPAPMVTPVSESATPLPITTSTSESAVPTPTPIAPSASESAAPSPVSIAPSASESVPPAQIERCVPGAVCYKDQDCGVDNPNSFCAGSSLLGTCRCSACLTGLPCNDDADCGGLRHACLEPANPQQPRVCNCRAAFKENGFPSYVKALTTFCNIRECDGEKDVCFGLPCRNGVCVCPA